MATVQTRTSPQHPAGHKFIEGTLSKTLLQFDLAAELDQLHRDDSWLQAAGRSSRTLVKHPDLRIVLIAMKPDTRMHEHTAAARISVHTLRGRIRLHLPGRQVELPAGSLLALGECVPHDVEALEESAFLLTLSWPPQAEPAPSKSSGRKLSRRRKPPRPKKLR